MSYAQKAMAILPGEQVIMTVNSTLVPAVTSDPKPWYEYQGWKIWHIPESNYFVCVRDDAGKVVEVDRTLPISNVVRLIERVLDDNARTPAATWKQIRQIATECKAAFWANLLEIARHQGGSEE